MLHRIIKCAAHLSLYVSEGYRCQSRPRLSDDLSGYVIDPSKVAVQYPMHDTSVITPAPLTTQGRRNTNGRIQRTDDDGDDDGRQMTTGGRRRTDDGRAHNDDDDGDDD